MKVHFFSRSSFAHLPPRTRIRYEAMADRLYVREGRPFFLDPGELPDELLDDFCQYLLAPARASPQTWKTYAAQISLFLRFLKAQVVDWRQVDKGHIDSYFAVRTSGDFQDSHPITHRSWNIAAAAIIKLYEYAVQKEIIDVLPFKYKEVARFGGKAVRTTDITAKSTDKPVNFISIESYKLHWRSQLSGTRNSQRNLALVDLLITTGLRISEALSLEVHQIPDPDNLQYRALRTITIRVVGKGNKIRDIRIPKRIVRLIRFYIDEDRGRLRERIGSKKNPIFLTRTGKSLSVRDAESLFGRASKATGLKLTPHGCRHTFAIYQLDSMIKKLASNLQKLKENGADAYTQVLNDPLRNLQRMLGHASIQTTYIYLDFLEDSEALVDESLEAWTDWRDDR